MAVFDGVTSTVIAIASALPEREAGTVHAAEAEPPIESRGVV